MRKKTAKTDDLESTFKAILILAIIVAAMFMSSCGRYAGYGKYNGKGCGVWYPKTFKK